MFEKLDDKKVLITLRHDDLKTLGLSFDKALSEDEQYEKKLRGLLLLALSDAGIDMRGKRFLLELLPCNWGCMLLISAFSVHTRKRYRIKKITDFSVCIFKNFDDLLDAMRAVSSHALSEYPNSLYRYKDCFVLIFDYPLIREDERRILSEYGRIKMMSTLSLAGVREHSDALICRNAFSFFENLERRIPIHQRHIAHHAVRVGDA